MKMYPALLALTLLAMSAPAQTDKAKGMAVLKNDVFVADDGWAALPSLTPGQVLPCFRELDNGFLVGCHDADGNPRVAFLPLRDEWGHVSARARLFDPSSQSNTVRVLTPVPLKPGWIQIEKGAKYPILSSDDKGCTVQVSFAGFAREVVLAGSDAEILPPPKPETDPVKRRAQQLAGILEQSAAQLADLKARLAATRADADRLASLDRDIAATEIEKNRVRTEVLKAEAVCRELVAATPAPQQPALAALIRQAEQLAQKEAELEARKKKAELEIEPLRTLHKQLVSAEGDIEKIKAASMASNSELEALRKGQARDDVKQDKETAVELLDGLAKQNADITGQIQQLDLGTASLKTFTGKLEAIRQENTQLQAQLQTLTAELQDLQKKIQKYTAAATKAQGGNP